MSVGKFACTMVVVLMPEGHEAWVSAVVVQLLVLVKSTLEACEFEIQAPEALVSAEAYMDSHM